MEFFTAGVGVLKTLVTAIGAGLGAWGVINLMEGYGNDCLLYTSPSPRDLSTSRMPSSA